MTYVSDYRYYSKYLQDPTYNIPIPQSRQYYTQDQKKNECIGYIVNDKMSIKAVSKKKAKMGVNAGKAYYHKYFDDQNPDIATSSHITIPKQYTQEQIKEVIRYIVNDKMSIRTASIKANIHRDTATTCYRRYLKDNNMDISLSKRRKCYTQDEIKQFIRCIVDDKMKVKAASKNANMNYYYGRKYYRKYLNGQKRDTSI